MFSNIDIKELFAAATKEITEYINDFIKNINDKKSKFFAIQMLIKVLYSIIVDSDWLDSYLFTTKTTYEDADTLDKYIDDYILNIEKQSAKFKKLKAKNSLQQKVYDVRNQIADDCFRFSQNKTGVYTLTVPTGGGKTNSSFIFALNHAKKYNKDRIIYVAPYTSIIEQNASDIRDILKCGEKLLEYHSNIISEKTNNKEAYEDEDYIKTLSSRWDYPIIFTTIVQFLNTIFARPSQDIRKLQSVINSVIIIDEAQSVPIHCTTLFNEAVNFLSQYLNCTVILCTATQPVLHELKTPIKLSKDNEIIKNVDDVYETLKRVEVIDKTIPGGYSYETAIKLLFKLKENNENVLMVVNTIKVAEELFKLVKDSNSDSKLFYLSSNICPKHRKKLIDDIKEALNNNESVICISTQVIECGVDISFNTVIRSLAGLDSIAQASGRCNRHGEKTISETYVINIQDDLEKTQRILNIDVGKKKTRKILELYKQNSKNFDNSLLSTKSIYYYFKNFVCEQGIEKEFDYYLKKEDTSIYELLSFNNKILNYQDNKTEKFPLSFCFQFKTARKNFKVIPDNTKTIIVPYKEAREIILDLTSSIDLDKKFKLLKETQNYVVNIYEHKYIKLCEAEAFLPSEIEGVYLLKDEFYDSDLGIIMEKNMKLITV